jgi:hypothetical protein
VFLGDSWGVIGGCAVAHDSEAVPPEGSRAFGSCGIPSAGVEPVNTLCTRFSGRYGKIREPPGTYGKADISEQSRKMGYSSEKTGFSRFGPFLNGVQEVESSNLFAPTAARPDVS